MRHIPSQHLSKAYGVPPKLAQLMQRADIPVTATIPNISWQDAHALRVELSNYIIHVSNMINSQVSDLQNILQSFVHPERWNELSIVTNALRVDINNAVAVIQNVGSILHNFKGALHENDFGLYTECTSTLSDTIMKSQAMFMPGLITLTASINEALSNKQRYETPEAYQVALMSGSILFNRMTEPFTPANAASHSAEVGIDPINEVKVL